MMKKLMTNRPDRQNIRKVRKQKQRRQIFKPYGKKPAQAPA